MQFELTEVKCRSEIQLIVISWTSPGLCVTAKHTHTDVLRRALFQAARYEVHFKRHLQFQTYVINSPTRWLDSKPSPRSFRYSAAIFRKRFSQRRFFYLSSTSCERKDESFKRSIWIDSYQADSITNSKHNTHTLNTLLSTLHCYFTVFRRIRSYFYATLYMPSSSHALEFYFFTFTIFQKSNFFLSYSRMIYYCPIHRVLSPLIRNDNNNTNNKCILPNLFVKFHVYDTFFSSKR